MHFVLAVCTLLASVPQSGTAPSQVTVSASHEATLLDLGGAPHAMHAARLLDSGDDPLDQGNALLAEADPSPNSPSAPPTIVSSRRAEFEMKLKSLKLERSQMVSGSWAAGLMSGGIVTFLFVNMLVGAVSFGIGLIVGIYYLAASSDLDARIRETQTALDAMAVATPPSGPPLVAMNRVVVARF